MQHEQNQLSMMEAKQFSCNSKSTASKVAWKKNWRTEKHSVNSERTAKGNAERAHHKRMQHSV